jgi:glycosyltransferase involved in cell wall biosynthesis
VGDAAAAHLDQPSKIVYLHVWSGDEAEARAAVLRHYPGCALETVSHREMREAGFRRRIRALRSLRGRALVFYSHAAGDLRQRELLLWTGLVHGCRETAFADSTGKFQSYRRWSWLWLWPRLVAAVIRDLFALGVSAIVVARIRSRARSQPVPALHSADAGLDLAYLGVYPLQRVTPGGALSHMSGVLHGLAQNRVNCEVFSSYTLPDVEFPQEQIATSQRPHLFWETAVLGHNTGFAKKVRAQLEARRPRALYQRHGRFLFAGALLSQWLSVPLVLEYNGSEVWVAQHWDPSRFGWWLRQCEQVSLAQASLVVTVSNALREELIRFGVSPERILVNPNAVDAEYFHPNCGRTEVRQQLNIAEDEVLVGFVSTFSYFHGPLVLCQAIDRLLTESPRNVRLRFLLVGDGLLLPEAKKVLSKYVSSGVVIFSGLVHPKQVRSYLDACDILASPHVPMPDGRPFIGSPTKLFEYMAMGKAIVASKLGQLSEVLEHNRTAWLVEPGNVEVLAAAIDQMVSDPASRQRLGLQARKVVVEQHTWKQNAARILTALGRVASPNAAAAAGFEQLVAHKN